MNYNEALDTMCRRCINFEVCNGTGCNPKKVLADLISDEHKRLVPLISKLETWIEFSKKNPCSGLKEQVVYERVLREVMEIDNA